MDALDVINQFAMPMTALNRTKSTDHLTADPTHIHAVIPGGRFVPSGPPLTLSNNE